MIGQQEKGMNMVERWRKLGLLALALALLCPPLTGKAWGTQQNYDVTSFGANGTDEAVDQKAIQTALNKAKGSEQMVTVYVPAGTYYINAALGIYSNTTLKLDPHAVIRRVAELGAETGTGQAFGMLSARNVAGGDKNYAGYTMAQNITVEGGTWDGNSDSNTGLKSLMVFRHCKNISVQNCTITHGTYHYLNVSSSRNITVKGVTFSDAVEVPDQVVLTVSSCENPDSARARFECIHMDAEGHDNTTYDNTVCQDNTVTDCVFRNVYAGVGAHRRPTYDGEKLYAKNIMVSGNTFEDVQGHCVNAYQFRGLTVSDNRCTRVGSLAWLDDCTGVVSGQEVTLKRSGEDIDYGLRAANCPQGLQITDNQMSGDVDRMLMINQSTQAQASGNTLAGGENASVYLTGSTDSTIEGNTLSELGSAGIYLTSASKRNTVSSNTIIGKSNTVTEKGIQISSDSDSALVTNNTVQKAEYGIYVTRNTGVQLGYNSIISSGSASVYLTSFVKGAKITYNRMDSNGLKASTKATKTVLAPTLFKVCSERKKTLTAYWQNLSAASGWQNLSPASGYQVQYGTASNFKKAKTVTLSSSSTLKKKLSGLTQKKKYYVRVRAYQEVSGTTYYTQWSDSKSAKVS